MVSICQINGQTGKKYFLRAEGFNHDSKAPRGWSLEYMWRRPMLTVFGDDTCTYRKYHKTAHHRRWQIQKSSRKYRACVTQCNRQHNVFFSLLATCKCIRRMSSVRGDTRHHDPFQNSTPCDKFV